MKIIIIKKEGSTIQLDQVKETDYIIAKKQDKICDIIYQDNDSEWGLCISNNEIKYDENLSDLLSHDLLYECEFYVLD